MHILAGTNFIEPIGGFGLEALNSAMLDFSLAIWLLILFEWVISKVKVKAPKSLQMGAKQNVLIGFVLILVIALSVINWKLGFFRAGLASETKIPFPFGTIYMWFLGPASAVLTFFGLCNLNPIKPFLVLKDLRFIGKVLP